MSDIIEITLDGQIYSVPAEMTILKAAQHCGIGIPSICYHDYCTSNGLCRICVVEVEGARVLVPACVAKVTPGMIVHTKSDRVIRARKTILEMLAASVNLSQAPGVQKYMDEYQVDLKRFPEARPREHDLIDDNPMYIRDYSRCILCWRCVQVCAEDAQYTFAINFSGRGYETAIDTYFQISMPETTCVFCGQCVGVCPTGALKSKKQWLLELGYQPDEIMRMTSVERKSNTGRQSF